MNKAWMPFTPGINMHLEINWTALKCIQNTPGILCVLKISINIRLPEVYFNGVA